MPNILAAEQKPEDLGFAFECSTLRIAPDALIPAEFKVHTQFSQRKLSFFCSYIWIKTSSVCDFGVYSLGVN